MWSAQEDAYTMLLVLEKARHYTEDQRVDKI